MYRRNTTNEDPMSMAVTGMNFLGNAMRTGQQIGEQRYQTDERDGLNKAYEYIAGKLGNQGDISQLDGDAILNTRQGTIAMGQFMQQRLNNETTRLGAMEKQAAADTHFYENTLRPMMGAATEAYKAGDMQRFGAIAGELSKKFPFPYRYALGEDGMFNEEFRSDKHEGWTATNVRITPQQAFEQLQGLMKGEQRVLVGANMRTQTVNPDFLAMSARYKWGTASKNAQNMADPKQWIPFTKGGKTMYAVVQNRLDDYSAEPSFYIMDEGGQHTGYYSGQQLREMGYVRADVKASVENAQRIAAGRGTGRNGAGADAPAWGGTQYHVSERVQGWIDKIATTEDANGNKIVNPYVGMALGVLIGEYGQYPYSALQAYQNGIDNIMESLRKENPDISQEEAKRFAEQYYCNYLRQQMQGGGKSAPAPAMQTPSPTPPDRPVQRRGTNKLSQSVKGAANGARNTQPEPEPLTPEEQHRRLVESGAGVLRGIPETLNNGWNWYWDSMKNNGE